MQTTMTTEERRLQRIAQLKAKLQKEEALLRSSDRKKRNGRLIALGILFEKTLPKMSPSHINTWLQYAEELDDRNKNRVKEAFRLLTEPLTEPNEASLQALEEARKSEGQTFNTVGELMDSLNAEN